jgi:hypothetical protein
MVFSRIGVEAYRSCKKVYPPVPRKTVFYKNTPGRGKKGKKKEPGPKCWNLTSEEGDEK